MTDKRQALWSYRFVAVFTVLPVFVSAIRAGLDGWVPTNDAAAAVLRAHSALGSSPTMVGLFAGSASYWNQTLTFMLSPWLLWWIAIPTKLLGTTWGPLAAMSMLNVCWIMLAGWMVKRRLGPYVASAAMISFGLLMWSVGNAFFYSPVPLIMAIVVFGTFLFGAWALACGDEGVLPAFALVTNFIVLNSLVLSMIVPIVGTTAIAMWIVGMVRRRSAGSSIWMRERGRTLRALRSAVMISVIAWLPVFVQNFSSSSGNFANLIRAYRMKPSTDLFFGAAASELASFISRPPFWLRGSRSHSVLTDTAPSSPVVLQVSVVGTIVLVGVILGVAAYRRRDRPAVAALILAGVSVIASWVNLATSMFMTTNRYYISVWVVAMFVTFALVFGLIRAIPARKTWVGHLARPVLVGVAVVIAALNVPHANSAMALTSDASDDQITVARQLNPQIVDAVRGRGRVALASASFATFPEAAAGAIALVNAGVPFCIEPNFMVSLFGSAQPICRKGWANWRLRYQLEPLEASNGRVVARAALPLSRHERRELRSLTTRIGAAIDRVAVLLPTAGYLRSVRETYPPGQGRVDALRLDFLGGPGGPLRDDRARLEFAATIAHTPLLMGNPDTQLVTLPGIDRTELLRWANLELRASTSYVVVMAPAK